MKAKLLLLLVAILFLGCKDNAKTTQTTPKEIELSANVNKNMSAPFVKATFGERTVSASDLVTATKIETVLNISGTADSGESIGITIANYKGVGSYDLNANPNGSETINIVMAFVKLNASAAPTSLRSMSGELNVTSDTNNVIKGTFSYDANDHASGTPTPVKVTNGTFEVKVN